VADPQQLRCRECGAVYAAGPIYVCEKCFGPLEAIYDYEALARQPLRRVIESGPPSIWRYEPLLPVNRVPEIDLSPGFTPLMRAARLGRALGLSSLYIKNDTMNPTWSFKDRVVAVAMAAALRFEYRQATSRTPWPPTPRAPGCGPVCSFRKALNRERSSPQRRIVLPWWKWRGRTTT